MDESAIDDLIAAYRLHCSENGLRVLPGYRVDERAAALLLGLHRGTLRNHRHRRTGPCYFRSGNGRISYALDALASWAMRDEC